MSQMGSYVVDHYDDFNGRVLKSLVSSPEDLPAFVKTAQRMSPDEIRTAPDDRFALIMLDEGHKLKKFAMTDPGNTALSVLYLLKQAHLLPPAAVKTAAQNLLVACAHYDLDPPYQLKVAAKAGMSGISGKSQAQYAKGAKVDKLQFPVPEPAQQATENIQLGEHVDHDVQHRTNYHGPQGTNFVHLPIFSQKEKVKEGPGAIEHAEKVAWDQSQVAQQRQENEQALVQLFNPGAGTKQQFWGDGKGVTERINPYVDVSHWDPGSAMVEDRVPPTQTLLGDRYPADSYDQVKLAAAYFAENHKDFHPRDRHEYCTKLASRLAEMGLTASEDVERYGSLGYAADVDALLAHRRTLIDEPLIPALDTLMEKRASVSPDTFADTLAEFDRMAGLSDFWDAQIPDPWWTTFGPSIEKLAEDDWRYDEQGARIGMVELENLARNGKHLLKKSFRDDLVEQFLKSPKSTFESLPRPEKLLIARMAMDHNTGSGTE